MLEKMAAIFDRVMRKYTPDPFVIAAILTLAVLVLSWSFTEHSAQQIVRFWGQGFWDLISFTLQMVMVLVGGYIVASSSPVQRLLATISKLACTPVQAIIITTLTSCLASGLNWGLGLVVGAFMALEMSKRVPTANFRVLVASAYSGFIVWHGGLSGSVPLLINTEGNFSQEMIGRVIPTSETLFSPLNMTAFIGLLILLPLLNVFMGRNQKDSRPIQRPRKEKVITHPPKTFSERLNQSRIVTGLISLLGVIYLTFEIVDQQFSLDLNRMNYIFLFAGLLLHGTPQRFVDAAVDASKKVGPILIQYPLYAAIMSIMVKSGLADLISQGFISLANETTFPLLTFYSAGLVNFFVPSGGGQWAVQAPIVIPVAHSLGVDVAKVAMAVAWGDAWTNMAQPFWALPLLSIAGLTVKDIMGFCLMILIASGIFLSSVFLLF